MNRRLLAITVPTAGLLILGLTAAPATAASCTPTDAVPAVPATYETIPNPDYIPAVPPSVETQTTGWRTEAPEGEGWVVIDSREVVDQEAVEAVVEVHRKYKRWVEPTYVTVDNPDHVPEHTVEHDAIGEPTIEVIDTPAWVEEVHHDAVYEHIEHDAVYEEQVTKVEFKKWKIFWTDYKWFPANAQPNKHSGWIETGRTKAEQVKVKDAWTEKVTVEDAWTEEIHHPATYKTVPNPDHVPAWTETIPAQGEPTIDVVDTPGHYEKRWTVNEQLDAPWALVRAKDKTITEGQDAVTRDEHTYERSMDLPGLPAIGAPTLEVMVDPGTPAVPAVECTTIPDVDPEPTPEPEPEPSPDVQPVVDTEPVTAPEPTPEPQVDRTPAADRTGPRDELAHTGADAGLLALGALGLAGTGAAMRIAAQRKNAGVR